jgi:hypothetical protein
MSDLVPSTDELVQRAARHLAQAAKETDPDKAAQHRIIADILLKEAEAMAGANGEGSSNGPRKLTPSR